MQQSVCVKRRKLPGAPFTSKWFLQTHMQEGNHMVTLDELCINFMAVKGVMLLVVSFFCNGYLQVQMREYY